MWIQLVNSNKIEENSNVQYQHALCIMHSNDLDNSQATEYVINAIDLCMTFIRKGLKKLTTETQSDGWLMRFDGIQ